MKMTKQVIRYFSVKYLVRTITAPAKWLRAEKRRAQLTRWLKEAMNENS